jgi:hypothetical protein
MIAVETLYERSLAFDNFNFPRSHWIPALVKWGVAEYTLAHIPKLVTSEHDWRNLGLCICSDDFLNNLKL